MGYSLFSIGDVVRISQGSFAGVEGTIIAPIDALDAAGTVILRRGAAMLIPLTVAACVEGHPLTLRVPPDLLERVSALSAAPQ